MRVARPTVVIAALLGGVTLTCSPAGTALPWPATTTATSSVATVAPPPVDPNAMIEVAYRGALSPGWSDWGWSPRVLDKGAAQLQLADFGGWILQHDALARPFGALVFRLQAPKDAHDFLEVHLLGPGGASYPLVIVSAAMQTAAADGFVHVRIPFKALDPDLQPFDRIFFRAAKQVTGTVLLDDIGFTEPNPEDLVPRPPKAPKPVTLSVDCKAKGIAISPLVYGIAYDPQTDAKDQQQWSVGATVRRWGGNVSSRYNWELGNAWSGENDWYFENLDYSGVPGFSYATFLEANLAHGMSTALSIPMLGWVAKDTTSYSYSVKLLGPQAATDPYKPDAGNGKTPDGKSITAPPPTTTSVAAPPELMKRWIQKIRAADTKRGRRSVQMYILDNEPNLWSVTHRDVHPQPLGYDELLEKTLAYAAAIRAADPDAVIAGPAEWGWTNYFYSGKDMANGLDQKIDRKAHGDVPLVAWYLKKIREHETKTKTKVLDVFDLHFYPQGEGIYGGGGATDPDHAARRLRATRALWDPSYVDESWIADTVQLLPRMQKWIDDNAPGVGISIGEWNFGAEGHASGGLAIAEALGRFGQHGVRSAFYWTYPTLNSWGYWAFRAYRNFDGQGGRFLDRSLPTKAAEGASIFASRDEQGKHVVIVTLNLEPDRALAPTIVLEGCGKIASERAFRYVGAETGIVLAKSTVAAPSDLPPYSITIHDLQLDAAIP